jgi:hypothetical protein
MLLRFALTLLLACWLPAALVPTPSRNAVSTHAVAQRGDCCDPSDDGEDDCCPGGCHHCPLPCCGGSLALVGCSVTAPDVRLEVSSLTPAAPSGGSGIAPRQIYHPPRI